MEPPRLLSRLLSRLAGLLRREKPPAMIGAPPSARPAIPEDPADHAEDFSRRYEVDLDIAAGQLLTDLGIDPNRIGVRDPDDQFKHKSFLPGERTCGSLAPDGRIALDSGVMNPEVMDGPYGKEAGDYWRKLRLPDRMQSAGAHEYEEYLGGGHEAALRRGPETELPVSDPAREMLRMLRDGWRGRG